MMIKMFLQQHLPYTVRDNYDDDVKIARFFILKIRPADENCIKITVL